LNKGPTSKRGKIIVQQLPRSQHKHVKPVEKDKRNRSTKISKPTLAVAAVKKPATTPRVLEAPTVSKAIVEKAEPQQQPTRHPSPPPDELKTAGSRSAVSPARRRASHGDTLTFIEQALDETWNDYLLYLGRFQQTQSGKNVHDLRVSIRRFATALDLVDRFSPDNTIRRARNVLKEQLSELSNLRDVHVEMVRVRRFLKDVPEMRPFYDDLRSKEARGMKSTRKLPWKANRKFIETAVNRAKIKINARRSTTTAESSRKILETGLDVAFDGLSKRLEVVTLSDFRTIHKIRLSFKPVRYMLEMVRPVLKLDRRQLRTASLLSRLMGQIQDLEVLMKDLVEFGWKKETVLSAVQEIWLDLERRNMETAQRFIRAIPKFSEIWKPIIYEQTAPTPTASKTLYILRHGIAVTRDEASYPLDSDRPLTQKGLKKMRRIADGMRHLKVSFDTIVTSPYKRALETAFVVGRQYGEGQKIQTCPALAAEVLPEEVIRILQEKYGQTKELLLVGHEPQLSALISTLTSGSAGARPLLKKGGLCKLQVETLQIGKCATLAWLLTPRQLVNIT